MLTDEQLREVEHRAEVVEAMKNMPMGPFSEALLRGALDVPVLLEALAAARQRADTLHALVQATERQLREAQACLEHVATECLLLSAAAHESYRDLATRIGRVGSEAAAMLARQNAPGWAGEQRQSA